MQDQNHPILSGKGPDYKVNLSRMCEFGFRPDRETGLPSSASLAIQESYTIIKTYYYNATGSPLSDSTRPF